MIKYQMVLVPILQAIFMGLVSPLHENIENLYSLIEHRDRISLVVGVLTITYLHLFLPLLPVLVHLMR